MSRLCRDKSCAVIFDVCFCCPGTDSTNPSIGDFSMLESLKVRTGSDDKSQKTLKYDDSACQNRDNSVYAIRDNSVCASRASSDISKDTNVCNDSLTSDSLCYLNHESYLVDPVELHTSSLEIESIATIPHHSFTDSPPIELEPARTNGNSEVIYQDNIMKIVSHPTTTRLDELASDINSFTKEDLTGSPTVRFLDKNDFLQEKDGYLLPRHSTPNEDLEQFDYVNSFPKSWFAYDQRPSVGTSSARQAYSSRDASHSAKAKLTTHGYSTGLANTRDKDQAVYYFMEGNREFNQSCTNAESIDWNNHGLSSEDSDDGSSASSSSEGHVMDPQNLDCAVGNLDNLVTNGEKNRKEDKQDRFTDEACGHDAEQSSSSGSNAKNMRPGVKSSAEVCAVTSPATRHESTLSRYPIGAGRSSRGGPQPPHISAASIIFGKDDLNERFPQNQLSHNEVANSARQSVPCQGGDRLPRVDASQQKHLEGGGEGSSTSVRCNQHKSARDVLLRRALENSFVQSTTESCAMTFSQCPPRAGQTPVVSDGQPVRNSQLASLNRSKKCEPRASYKKHQSVEWKKQRIRLPDIGIQDNSLSVHENSFVSEQFPGLPKCIHGRPRVATEREGRRGNNIQASTTATEKWLFSEAAESCCSESSQTFIHKDLTFSPIVPDSAASSSDPSNFVISSWSANTDKHCASIDQKSSQKEPSAARSKQSISTSQEENNVRNEMVEETCSDSSISLSDSMYSKGSINQNNLLSSPLRSMLKGSRYASHKGSVTDMSTLERRVSFKEPEVIKVEHSGSDFNISGYRPVSPLPTVQQLDSRSCQSEGSPTADHQFGGSGQRHVLQSSPPCKNISTKQNSNSPQNTSAHLSHSSVENSYGSSQRSEVSASTLSFSYFPAIYAHRAHHRLNKCEMKPAQEQQLDVNASPSRRDSQHFPKLSQISNRHFLGKPVCGHEHQQITDESRHRCNGWGRSRKPATAKKASEHLNVCAYNSQSHLSDATAPAKISGTNLQNPAHPGDICWPTGQSPSLPSMGAKVAAQLHGTRSAHLCNPRKVPEPRNPSTHKWKRHQPKSQTCHLVSGSGPLQYIQEPLKLNTATALVAATMSDKACLSDEVVARSTAPGTLEKSTLTEKLNPCGNSTSDASGVQQIQGQSPIKFASLRYHHCFLVSFYVYRTHSVYIIVV